MATLRVLIVEDNADDAELVLRQLGRAGFQCESARVDDAAGLRQALDAREWDIVVADYNLPGFSGLDALLIVNETGFDIPFVLVSGAVDVPTALEAMKAGAKDFVPKDDTARLPSVVERELAETAQRKQRKLAEEERDRALAELRAANEQLTAFVKLTDVPFYEATLEEFLEHMIERLVKTVGADGSTVDLLGDDEQTAETVLVGQDAAVAFDGGFSGVVASHNAPVFVRDSLEDDDAVSRMVRPTGFRTALGVPMHYAGRIVGVLTVGWRILREPSKWQVPLLEMAADRIAIAIENVRRYQQEHAIAQTLQQALLSASTHVRGLDIGQFYASATVETLVGGDYYDVFETARDCVCFSIGDVSGKGLKAASVTALVKNALRAIAVDCPSPETVMNRGNDVVARFTDVETFVTAIFGVLDLTTGEMTFANAGHPAPVILGPDGVAALVEHGPLLGTDRAADYISSSHVLRPCESVVLYTDGLTEARRADGEFFGEARLYRFLAGLTEAAPQDIATALFDEVWEFSDGKLRDDLAVLVLRPRIAAHEG
ncbi:MAG: SpoIIE family protein phosphatase [Coriobacteriales bacterium]|nr:SpoIIE family protein phosphatase [Coriobacteriales bacterium]